MAKIKLDKLALMQDMRHETIKNAIQILENALSKGLKNIEIARITGLHELSISQYKNEVKPMGDASARKIIQASDKL